MTVAVMEVRKMGMAVMERAVRVPVGVRRTRKGPGRMRMLVMRVVVVPVFVLDRLVAMLVLVALGHVQPNTDPHEHSSHHEMG